ncbi:hydrogen peroxide-inducible genes activator [Polynucleobacter kasalickyi]|uniref:LysR family transcriptional regulator, hydrogen peroxide-inducible genes activator n=1 Tax=Polynucleobacter kasalickyi TaxID=1938817 RepID=A0A1W2BCU4_9BURK|nr:hydrogen peroxide-inducible genes activator [Polynucleobacter kasalickyi]SMC70726.1 LysR family transcriptional regulator, hydrogen peroxide-inducible genes activator [Polynucleobacter kasalickyi]
MASTPTIKQLRYLQALNKTLSFTEAAALCFVGQSTLSAGLKELEGTLGVQLVERDKQTVSITPIGKEVIERAERLLAQADDLVDFVDSYAGSMVGVIKLGVIPTIAPFILPALMPVMREKYPDLQIALREDLSGNLIDKLDRHELDFALIALPYDTEGFLVKELFDDEFWLIAKEGDPIFKKKDVHLSHQMSDRVLLLEDGHCIREHTLMACRRSELVSHNGIEATSLLTLVQMVESGLGIALLPEMAVKSGLLSHMQLIARPLATPSPKRKIALIARPSTARIEEFNALVKVIKNLDSIAD